ncbi:hypothetical protein ACFL20_06660 [Spirochaetota bacterium]
MKRTKIKMKLFLLSIFTIMIAISLNSDVFAQTGKEKEKDKKEKISKDIKKENEEVKGWRIKDYKPYIRAIKELEKLNKEYSDNILKMAIDEFSTGIDILDDMENDVLKYSEGLKSKKYLNERWYWQEIDRKRGQKRKIYMMKRKAKLKAITFFTRAIMNIDNIRSNTVRQDSKFISFQTQLFQIYVSTNYDLHNFKPCIPILERYITLSDKAKKDVWAYKYLTSCYGYMEKVLEKTRISTEDLVLYYKHKKNRSMLRAVELKYGVDSPHFKHLQAIVETDEKKSQMINDFK